MAASAQSAKTHCITLSASAKLVCEYLDYGISSILFQRGIYPHYRFNSTTFYGSGQFFKLKGPTQNWIRNVLWQVEKFIIRRELLKFTIVIYNTATLESIEWWEFVVDNAQDEDVTGQQGKPGKPLKRIHLEIREVMRQISSTVSFLPFLDFPCDFDFAVQCIPGTIFPPGWLPCDFVVSDCQEVNLKRFGTGYHYVSTSVFYKGDV